MSDRYSSMSELAMFGFLANAMKTRGMGGDRDASFPRSDAEDLSRGCRFVPGEVTMARRRGERVQFVGSCWMCCWYWQMPDGSRIYHFERSTYEDIKRANKVTGEGDAGSCPKCGNPHTSGGHIAADQFK